MTTLGSNILSTINNLYKYSFENNNYFSLNDLMLIKVYSKGSNNNKKQFIKKMYNEDSVIFGRIELDGRTIKKDIKYSPKYSKYYIKSTDVIKPFISKYNDTNYKKDWDFKELPELIDNNDFCFFKDNKGIEYHVEMRGKRNKNDIYFKCSDLENLFEMYNMHRVVTLEHTDFSEHDDFNFFTLLNLNNVETLQDKKILFLTFSGLMKIVKNSRVGRAKEFSDWLDNIVFTAIAGNEEQRIHTSATIMNKDIEEFKKMFNKHAGTLACIYIINTNIKVGDDIIYKFGFSKNLDQRFKDHIKTFGNNIELETFCLISENLKSKAETEFKEAMEYFNRTYNEPGFDTQTELLFLNTQTKKILKSCLSDISNKYAGDNIAITNAMQAEINSLKNKIICLEHKLELKDRDFELKDKDIELLKMKIELMNFKYNI